MAEESKPLDVDATKKAAEEALTRDNEESGSEDEGNDAPPTAQSSAAGAAASKKKKSKRKKIKAALTGGDKDPKVTQSNLETAVGSLSKQQMSDLLSLNPALAREVGLKDGEAPTDSAMTRLKALSLQDIMTGLAASGKNAKDMASYKFWQTQPVPKFGENTDLVEEGPFKIIDPEQVPKNPPALMEGFEWVTMDMTQEEQLQEVFELLYGHYVEDEEAMFRFNYSTSFFRWALLAPGWKADWHVGVRVQKTKKLVAFISGVPVSLRVRQKVLKAVEINFLCIHKKLRSKRLAPVLIKEITRRSYLVGVYQAIYTAGVVLPTPVSTCRYFHRSLDWQKLYEVGFSPLPPNSKPSYQIQKYKLPENTSTKGLRPMELKDADQVLDLLTRYLKKFDMAPVFTAEEVTHWLVHQKDATDKGKNQQVVWSYVVEDPATKKITDYFSFYLLESTVIGNPTHQNVRAAYLFYYASETALATPYDKSAWKRRINDLMHDALILAKKQKFDVFNALSLLDNGLFLEEQKFGKGDGQLHYYLYNYKANPIAGGVDKRNEIDEKGLSGVGVVML